MKKKSKNQKMQKMVPLGNIVTMRHTLKQYKLGVTGSEQNRPFANDSKHLICCRCYTSYILHQIME